MTSPLQTVRNSGVPKTDRIQVEQGLLRFVVGVFHQYTGSKSERVGCGSHVEVKVCSSHEPVVKTEEDGDKNTENKGKFTRIFGVRSVFHQIQREENYIKINQ